MAFTVATMSFAGSAAVLSGGAGAPSSSLPPSSVSQLRRPAGSLVRVRCQAENSEEPATGLPVSPPPPKASPLPPPTTTTKKVMMSTKFSDVLAFSGPAPERINGRLAMVGFVAALGVELTRGDGLAAQVAGGDGVAWFLATAAALSLASLVPLFKGVTAESRSGGVMTSDAELWNGRFAMLGLVALAFTEYVKGGPLVFVACSWLFMPQLRVQTHFFAGSETGLPAAS